jgi:hypothetical protein
MTRLSLYAMFATFMAAPWSGCEREPAAPEPVSPPAVPPAERASFPHLDFGGAVLLDELHRRG